MAVIGNSATQQAFTPAVDYFSGNGSTTAFTLSRPVASVAQVEAVIDNVAQNPSSAYTVSANTITFTGAPSSGTNNIYVYYTSPITQVIQPGQGTVGTTQLVDANVTASKLASGSALSNIGSGGITQAYLASSVAGTGPAFSAYMTAGQSFSSNTWTAAVFDTKLFDTATAYSTSTGKFQPTVAGYYQLSATARFTVGTTNFTGIAIYKNGSSATAGSYYGNLINGTVSSNTGVSIPLLMYLNGSTDFAQVYVYSSGTSPAISNDTTASYFQGVLVRSA